MRTSNKLSALLLVLLLGAFAAGLYALFGLRFEAGDVFPAYSSLRSDPLGTKAFYRALEHVQGISCTRNYREVSKLAGTVPMTLFRLGLRPGSLNLAYPHDKTPDQLQSLAQKGARIVLSFEPVKKKPFVLKRTGKAEKAEEKPAEGPLQPEGEKSEEPAKEELAKTDIPPSLSEKLGVSPNYAAAPKAGQQVQLKAQLKEPVEALPADLPLHTLLYFDKLGPEWRVLYAAEDRPIVIERSLGHGSIVLVADSYFFSNEAMLKERYSGLLAWLAGGNASMVFDEYHLGVQENPGVMFLVRKYRLHGFLAGLILLAGLFVWRNSVPRLPARTVRQENGSVVSDVDQLGGLVGLLKRNIEPAKLLAICFDEWEKSTGRSGRENREKVRRVRELVESAGDKSSADTSTVALYREIAQNLSDRKFK